MYKSVQGKQHRQGTDADATAVWQQQLLASPQQQLLLSQCLAYLPSCPSRLLHRMLATMLILAPATVGTLPLPLLLARGMLLLLLLRTSHASILPNLPNSEVSRAVVMCWCSLLTNSAFTLQEAFL
jgi:hypothetical protein